MSIDPMKPGSANPAGGPRIDQAGSNSGSSKVSGQFKRVASEARDADADDSVQLSARAKSAGSTGSTSASGLSADRLQTILKRLTSGYYDSPQVVDRVAERVKDDLTGQGPVA